MTRSNAQAGAQFSSQLHLLHPGDCWRRNWIAGEKSPTLLTDGFCSLSQCQRNWLQDLDKKAAGEYLQLEPFHREHGVSATSVP